MALLKILIKHSNGKDPLTRKGLFLSGYYINIPSLDVIQQIPAYAKFFKDCFTHKRKFQEHETVALMEVVSVVLLRKLPPKLKDPGSFTIPCRIGD